MEILMQIIVFLAVTVLVQCVLLYSKKYNRWKSLDEEIDRAIEEFDNAHRAFYSMRRELKRRKIEEPKTAASAQPDEHLGYTNMSWTCVMTIIATITIFVGCAALQRATVFSSWIDNPDLEVKKALVILVLATLAMLYGAGKLVYNYRRFGSSGTIVRPSEEKLEEIKSRTDAFCTATGYMHDSVSALDSKINASSR